MCLLKCISINVKHISWSHRSDNGQPRHYSLQQEDRGHVWCNKESPQWGLNINGQPINLSKKVKHLGVISDKNLIMSKQSEYIIERKHDSEWILSKYYHRFLESTGESLKLHNTDCVRPILEYGARLMCLMWNTRQTNIQRIEHKDKTLGTLMDSLCSNVVFYQCNVPRMWPDAIKATSRSNTG